MLNKSSISRHAFGSNGVPERLQAGFREGHRNAGYRNVVLHGRWPQATTLRGIQKENPTKREKFSKNVFRCQKKRWMDEALVLDWTKSVWSQRPGALLGLPSILLLDSFWCHIAD